MLQSYRSISSAWSSIILLISQHLPTSKSKMRNHQLISYFWVKIISVSFPTKTLVLPCEMPGELDHWQGFLLDLPCSVPTWGWGMWQSPRTNDDWGQIDTGVPGSKVLNVDIEVFLSFPLPPSAPFRSPPCFPLRRSACWCKWTTQGGSEGGIGEPGRRLPAATGKTQLLQQLSNQPQPGDST